MKAAVLPLWIAIPFWLLYLSMLYTHAESACVIHQESANCSHLKLSTIPANLPTNITILDISHNQLKGLPPANLSRYTQLARVDAGFNVITKLEPGLCQSLPRLGVLNLQHNELHLLNERFFSFCENLTELRLDSNRIKDSRGDIFKNLKKLQKLDLSHNELTSTRLGSEQQLENLQELLLPFNKINRVAKEDLDFLRKTSIETLDLSSNPLQKFLPGCFHSIGSLQRLILNKIQLSTSQTQILCSELSGTVIQTLVLSNNPLLTVNNSTFIGLEKTNLTILDLSKCDLSIIEDSTFHALRHLEYLTLEDNHIDKLTPQTFSGLSNVKFLNMRNSLSRSKHPRVKDFSFQPLQSLENLILDDNSFQGFTENIFTGLTSLKYLSLSRCSLGLKTLTNVTFSSLANSSLTLLNLTKCGISKLESGAFSSLRRLRILEVGRNNIDQELTGEEFIGLDNIEVIYISYNKHVALGSDSLRFVPSLNKLMIRSAGITTLDLSPSPFRFLQNLTVLDLSKNNIANVHEDIFNGLLNLSILNLEHNNLARIWKSANPGGPVLFLKGLLGVQIIRLGYTGLDEIPLDAFKGLSQLRELELQSNMLNILKPSLFEHQVSLRSLNLQKNLVTAVEKSVFEPVFKSLENLNMGFNPFECTCESILFFVYWLNITKANVPRLTSEYICNTPRNYHGLSVMRFDPSPCKDSAPFRLFFIINTTIVLAFMAAAIIIHFQGWRIQFYWHVSVNRILGFREIDRENRHFNYDAYIIHAEKDNEWTGDNLIPLEKMDANNLTFCYEDRDLEPGTSVGEAIVKSMNQSRKIIFVVTDNFLTDPWCRRFKVHHAVQQAIEQSLDSIILIFIDNIPDYKLYQTIGLRRGMFKSNCILFWPLQQERVNAFFQKLKVAVGSSNQVI